MANKKLIIEETDEQFWTFPASHSENCKKELKAKKEKVVCPKGHEWEIDY